MKNYKSSSLDGEKRKEYGEFDIFKEPSIVEHDSYLMGLSYYNEIHDVYHEIPNNYNFENYKIFRFKGYGYYDEENNMYGNLYLKVRIKNYDKTNFDNVEYKNMKKRNSNKIFNFIFEYWWFMFLGILNIIVYSLLTLVIMI